MYCTCNSKLLKACHLRLISQYKRHVLILLILLQELLRNLTLNHRVDLAPRSNTYLNKNCLQQGCHSTLLAISYRQRRIVRYILVTGCYHKTNFYIYNKEFREGIMVDKPERFNSMDNLLQ